MALNSTIADFSSSVETLVDSLVLNSPPEALFDPGPASRDQTNHRLQRYPLLYHPHPETKPK